jgi:coenzyme PQQ precursor peptide PqqA
MTRGLGGAARGGEHAPRDEHVLRGSRAASVPPFRRHPMQWQTPTAVDFRFGFEITLYVAAR